MAETTRKAITAMKDCPHCKSPIEGRFTTINDVPHHIECANERWREWFGVDLVPAALTERP